MDLRPIRRPLIRLAAALLAAATMVLGLAAGALAAPETATEGASFTRVGRAPAIPSGSSAQGALPDSSVIDTTVALTPRDPTALSAYAQAVSTPGSPLYQHYLTVAEFAQRFAPEATQVAAVRAALEAQGLEPGPLAANGLSIDVTATAAQLSSALSTSFERYQVPSGRTAFANTTAPSIPSSVAGLVRGVVGLDTLQVPTPADVTVQRAPPGRGAVRPAAMAHDAPGSSGACGQASATGGYTAAQIASAYGLDDLWAAGDGGRGTTIALFELESYSANDIANYQRCYGTSTSISNIAVDGGQGGGPGSGEAALDIEDLIGLVPQASILVYEGKNTGNGAYDTYRAIVSQNKAKVISTSWGRCEPQLGSSAAGAENDLFIEAVTQGQSVFAASGDDGVQDYGEKTNQRAVDDPASQPWVTGVGGTSLTSGGPPPAETAWNSTWNGGATSGAGGGGVSSVWGAPSYQSGFTIPQSSVTCIGTHSTSCREVPDVSADADILTGYANFYNHHWNIFGGTSAAAPTWAALAALANSSAACSGRTVGFANPALYQAARTSYGSYFNDVASGNNSYGGLTGFSAGTGYDMAAGLGSPKGAAVAAALCGSTWTPPTASTGTTSTPTATPPPPPPPPPVVMLSQPSAQNAHVGQAVRVQLPATDSAGQTLSWRAAGLPPGLSISRTTGLISGTSTEAGKATAAITVSDTSGVSANAGISWNVAGRPTISGGLTVSRQGRPSLALRVGAGTNAPALQSIVVVPSAQIRFARRARDLAHGITVRNASGHRLASTARLRRGDLVVTLRSRAVRSASLRVTVPAIALLKRKTSGKGRQRSSALRRLSVTTTDASAFRTAFSVI